MNAHVTSTGLDVFAHLSLALLAQDLARGRDKDERVKLVEPVLLLEKVWVLGSIRVETGVVVLAEGFDDAESGGDGVVTEIDGAAVQEHFLSGESGNSCGDDPSQDGEERWLDAHDCLIAREGGLICAI